MPGQLSWRQHLLLEAASQVDHLDLRATRQINIEHGVWRSLVIRGLMREISGGWQITERGHWVLKNVSASEPVNRKERLIMDGKLPRYCVSRLTDGWAVRDRSAPRFKTNTDIVDKYPTRESARARCRELNLAEIATHAPIENERRSHG